MTSRQLEALEREAIRCGWTDSPTDVSRSIAGALSMWAFLAESLALCAITVDRASIAVPLAGFALFAVMRALNANWILIDYHRFAGFRYHPFRALVVAFIMAPITGVPSLIVKSGLANFERP